MPLPFPGIPFCHNTSMATPLSTVRTILSLSFNSPSAFFYSLVMLALGVLAFFSKQLVFAPSSYESCLKVCGTLTLLL